MIHSFGNRLTEDLYRGVRSAKVRRLPGDLKEPALYKLDILNPVGSVEELRSPPGNRLEALRGDYAEFFSIRINSQWRIVLSQTALAEHLGISVQRVNEIVRGKRGITPETAWLFAKAFNMSPEFWLNLQSTRDLSSHRPLVEILPLVSASA